MKIETVIDLDNNKSYLLLDETTVDEKKYFYAVVVKEDLSAPTNEYAFIEEVKKEDRVCAKIVNNEELKQFLLTIFAKNYMELVEDIADGEKDF